MPKLVGPFDKNEVSKDLGSTTEGEAEDEPNVVVVDDVRDEDPVEDLPDTEML